MDYTGLQNMAYNQIVDKGTSMSIIRQVRSSFNPSSGGYTTTESSYNCYGVRLDFQKKNKTEGTTQRNSLQGMPMIEEDSALFLVAAKGLTISPTRTDRLSFLSTTYEIENVEILSPNGIDIIYKIKARK